ncbi:MAG: oligogalacturonate lyase family protein [Cyclobacteriaceae bacterium]
MKFSPLKTTAAITFGICLAVACTFNKPATSPATEPAEVEVSGPGPMPNEWIDEDTGHKIVRLSRRPQGGSSFYFHNNPFLKAENGTDDLLVFYGHTDSLRQLFTVNLSTLEITQITSHPARFQGEIVAPSRKEVFYQSRDSVFATHAITKESRLVYVFLENFRGRITTINANETLLAGTYASPAKDSIYRLHPDKGSYFTRIHAAKIPHTLFTVNVETGELKKLYSERAWLNHVQFSPTDPDLLMYDHEGPWHLVNRIWTINMKTGENQLMHERTIPMEIAGHEFFSRDGKIIWYDLQKPRGETFFLAGVNVDTEEKTIYKLNRNEWSIHFNISPDQSRFAGDSTQVARAPDGRWIYLFTPSGDSLISEKLVNMKHHGYRPLEPNPHFSPDGRWLIFRSDLDGIEHVYAVAIEK